MKIKKGCRIETSGKGRTANWKYHQGDVTKRKGDSVFVVWDGTSFEDEMDLKEVNLIEGEAQKENSGFGIVIIDINEE